MAPTVGPSYKAVVRLRLKRGKCPKAVREPSPERIGRIFSRLHMAGKEIEKA